MLKKRYIITLTPMKNPPPPGWVQDVQNYDMGGRPRKVKATTTTKEKS